MPAEYYELRDYNPPRDEQPRIGIYRTLGLALQMLAQHKDNPRVSLSRVSDAARWGWRRIRPPHLHRERRRSAPGRSCPLDRRFADRQMKATIEVWRISEERHPYPWRFAVTFNGVRHEYAGIPNQCETKRQASIRARWRAKWLENGTYSRHYASS